MPSTSTDRLNGLTTSVAIKPPCRVATTANITLYGEQTIDSVAVVDGDRVLVKDQTSAWQNGIYVAATGAWTRAKDFDGNRDVVQGTIVLVRPASSGTLFYEVQTANPIVIGTSNITFAAADAGVETLTNLLADTSSASNGDALIGSRLNQTGSVARTVHDKLEEWVSLMDFIPVAEHAAIFDYTSTYDCAAALQAAVDTQLKVVIPSGLFRIGSSVEITYQGCHIQGAGYGSAGTRLKRLTDTSFGPLILSAGGVGGEHTIIEDLKLEDYSGLSDTNTSPLLTIGCNDWTLRSCWLLNGYQGLYCPQASSNAHIEGNVFEASRKQGIYTYSAGLLKIIGNTFWKCTADISNPSDRSATIMLRKNPVYSFGTFDVNIIGNYFFETVYGHHIHAEEVEGIQIVGNFLTVASQVDPGQRDDIYLKDATRVEIVGNTANAVLNSYVSGFPDQRGSRYVVNIDTGCTDIQIGSNGFRAGISGTINDPNNSAVIFGSNTGIKLANATSTDKRVNNYYRRYATSDLTIGITFGGASTGWAYTAEARLVRSGEQVTGTIQIQITTKGSATGAFLITGLPYTSANVAGLQFVGGVRLNGINVTPNGARVIPNTTTMTVDKITAGTSAQLTDADFPAGASFVTVEVNYSVA